jgi:acyl-CoA synthetase (AMP-forming)/AMP-acid ligase II
MYRFTTSGTTGIAKSFTMSEELVTKRIAVQRAVKGETFSTIKSLFCDMNIQSWSGFRAKRWAESKGIKFYNNTGGSMETAIALFENEQIDGIVGYPGALSQYAHHNRNYRFRAVLATGAILTPTQSKNLRHKLSDQLFTSYGSSEVGSIALGTATQVENIPGCVGILCPNVEIKFDQINTIYVKTETMIDGYDDPHLTEQYFQDGWFVTGDKGYLVDDLLVLEKRI